MTNKKYMLDVCIPRYVNKANTKLDTYTRQFEEAQSITDYFREITPVQILADDVGTGKTWVAMMVIFSQLALSGIDGVQTKRKKRKHAVVIAPTRMVANKWVRELNYFNRTFVKDSQKTSIDQLDSTKELLDALEADKRGSVPQARPTLADLFKGKGKERPHTAAPQVLLLNILKTSLHIDKERRDSEWDNISNLQNRYEAFNANFDKSQLKGPLNSMLSQADTVRLIGNLRRYFVKCKSENWYDQDFDRTAWKTAQKKKSWKKWLESLADLLPPSDTGLSEKDKEIFQSRLNYMVQVISVIWSADHRSTIVPPKVVFKNDLEFEFSSRPILILQKFLSILDQGLPTVARPLFENTKPQLSNLIQLYNTNSKRWAFTKPQAKRIIEMLAAFAVRLRELSWDNITISDPLMERFSAAGVFQSPLHLHKKIKDVRSQENWQPLLDFLNPLLKLISRPNNLLQNSTSGRSLSEKQNKNLEHFLLRLKETILRLIDYEAHPEHVGSTFWDEQPKERAIHVIYMNDLRVDAYEKTHQNNKKEPTQKQVNYQKEVERTFFNLKKSTPISLVVVDEAHNWRRRAYGASSFQRFIQPFVQRTLLVSATPLHMGVEDLKSIIDLAIGKDLNQLSSIDQLPKWLNQFNKFKKSYSALFLSEGTNTSNHLLDQANEHQKTVAGCWLDLAGNVEALKIIEKKKEELTATTRSENYKLDQINIWSKLAESNKTNDNTGLKSLALAIKDLYSFQNDEFLNHLRVLIVKTRSEKHFHDSEQNLATRRYLCGKEACLNAMEIPLNPPADDAHLLMHSSEGIDNSCSGWVDLLGMRLSQMATYKNKSTTKNARLLTGLPSSYDALKASALFEDLSLKDKNNVKANCPILTKLYAEFFEKLIDQSSSSHPKITRTVEILLKNLKRGEKTLIFCQRIATVKTIAKAFNDKLKLTFDSLIKEIPNLTSSSITDPQFILSTTYEKTKDLSTNIAVQQFWGAIDESKLKLFYEYVSKREDNQNFPSTQFDARIVFLFSTVFKQLTSKIKQPYLTAYLRSSMSEDEAKWKLTADDDSETDEANPDLEPIERISVDSQDETFHSAEAGFHPLSLVTGETSFREKILDNFSSPFFPLVLVCSQVSQEGVDMHKFCRTIILHDLNWNPAVLEQRVGRLDRVGSYASELKLPVDIFIPFLANSYDEYQYARVLQRAEMQELIFGRNDTVVSDKAWEDKGDPYTTNNQSSNKLGEQQKMQENMPLLGNLIYGLFDMDLSAKSRPAAKFRKPRSRPANGISSQTRNTP